MQNAVTPKLMMDRPGLLSDPKNPNGVNGRFGKGNKYGGPKPLTALDDFRNVLRNKMTIEKWEALIDTVIAMSERGNLKAIEYLTDHSVGKPIATIHSINQTLDPVEIKQKLDEFLGINRELNRN